MASVKLGLWAGSRFEFFRVKMEEITGGKCCHIDSTQKVGLRWWGSDLGLCLAHQPQNWEKQLWWHPGGVVWAVSRVQTNFLGSGNVPISLTAENWSNKIGVRLWSWPWCAPSKLSGGFIQWAWAECWFDHWIIHFSENVCWAYIKRKNDCILADLRDP